MQIKAEEISSIIKEKIKGFDKQVDVKETGSSHPGRRRHRQGLRSRRSDGWRNARIPRRPLRHCSEP